MEKSSNWERVKKYKWHLIATASVLVILIIILSTTLPTHHQGKIFKKVIRENMQLFFLKFLKLFPKVKSRD